MIFDVAAGDLIKSHACKQDKECVFVKVVAVHDDTLSVMFEGRPTIISRYLTFTVRRGDFVAPAFTALNGHGKTIREGLRMSDVAARATQTPPVAPVVATPVVATVVNPATKSSPIPPKPIPQASLFAAAETAAATPPVVQQTAPPPPNRRRVFRASAPLPTLKE